MGRRTKLVILAASVVGVFVAGSTVANIHETDWKGGSNRQADSSRPKPAPTASAGTASPLPVTMSSPAPLAVNGEIALRSCVIETGRTFRLAQAGADSNLALAGNAAVA